MAHALEAPFLEAGDDRVTAALWYGTHLSPFPIDERIEGSRGTIRMGNREILAVHIPGHSPGSLAFLLDSDGQRVLFGQDIHGPLDESLLSDEDAYRRSLDLLAGQDADILCEGHYGVFRGKGEVRNFIRSFLRG